MLEAVTGVFYAPFLITEIFMRRLRRVALIIALASLPMVLPGLVAAAETVGAGVQIAQRKPALPRTATKKTRAATKKARAATQKTRVPAQQQKKVVKPAVVKEAARAWHFTRSLGTPTLIYGAESDDEILLSFSCQPETGLLRVLSQFGSRGLRPGDGAPIRLSSGKLRFEIAGTAFSTETRKDVDIGGATRIDPRLFALFRGGETLVVDVPGRKRSVPIGNAGASAAAFQKACMSGTASQSAPSG